MTTLLAPVETPPPSPCEETGEFVKSQTSATSTQREGGISLYDHVILVLPTLHTVDT
jgi:hypothetical protein